MIYYSIYKILVTNQSNILFQICFKILNKLRNFIIRYFDPKVFFNLWGFSCELPFSHELPVVLKAHPRYNQNLSRIAKLIKTKYADLKVIDVGANIGDTVFLLRKDDHYPILSIEGNVEFYKILKRNIHKLDDVFLENQFIGDKNIESRVFLKTSHGSTEIIENDIKSEQVRFVKLVDILDNHKEFQHSKLLKIDTDGYDTKIVIGSKDFILSARPVIFFEYQPQCFVQNVYEGFYVFSFIRSLGYKYLIVYEQYGDYMFSLNIDNLDLLQDLHCYLSVSDARRYCDICAFCENDFDLFSVIRKSELEFHAKL